MAQTGNGRYSYRVAAATCQLPTDDIVERQEFVLSLQAILTQANKIVQNEDEKSPITKTTAPEEIDTLYKALRRIVYLLETPKPERHTSEVLEKFRNLEGRHLLPLAQKVEVIQDELGKQHIECLLKLESYKQESIKENKIAIDKIEKSNRECIQKILDTINKLMEQQNLLRQAIDDIREEIAKPSLWQRIKSLFS